MLKMRENWFILNEQSVSLSLILQCPVEENYKEMVHKFFSFLPEASIHRLFFKLSYGYILFVTCTTLVYIYQSLDKWNIKTIQYVTLLDLCTRSFISTMMTWSNNPYVKHRSPFPLACLLCSKHLPVNYRLKDILLDCVF